MTLPDISVFYDEGENALQAHLDWLFEDTYHRQLEFVQWHFNEEKLMTVTEFGPGSGLLAHAFKESCPRLAYLGVEKSVRLCALARNRRIYRGDYDLTFQHEDGRLFNQQVDCVVSFGFLKHFCIAEWNDILKHLLAQGRFSCFDMQVSDEDFDNGSLYPHVFVTRERLERSTRDAGHDILDQQVWSEGDVEGHGRMQRVALWTKRR